LLILIGVFGTFPMLRPPLTEIPMEESSTTAGATVQPMPLGEKLINVLAAPGEVYQNIHDTPKSTATWFVPLIIMIVVSLVMVQVVMHNATIVDQIKTMVQEGNEKRLQDQIQSGKIPPERVDQAREQMEAFSDPTSVMMTVIRTAGIILGLPLVLLVVSFIYWLLGKGIMRATAPFTKVMEVVGLALVIGALESIVTTIISIAMKNFHAGPNLALAVLSDFSTSNPLHLALAKINIFTFWNLGVVSVGLSRLFNRDFPKVAVLVFALWIFWTVLTIMASVLWNIQMG
jgi:hypothetical protein